MLYFIGEGIRVGERLAVIEILVIFYIATKTLVMFGYTVHSLIKAVKLRTFVYEVILSMIFWIGWIAFLIVESVPRHKIGTGLGPFSPHEHLILLWPIYFPFALYAIITPWVILVVIITKFVAKKRREKMPNT